MRSSQSTKCNHKRRSNAPSFSSLRLPCVNSSPSGSIRTDSSPIKRVWVFAFLSRSSHDRREDKVLTRTVDQAGFTRIF
ncbi:Uncharacterised protein [Vibrio cholerae]|nr:Uncharacterised protein [Vibrio cholerae]